MKLSKNNIWLFFYQVLFCDKNRYAKSICDLFWGGLFGGILVITSPLVFITLLIIGLFTKRHVLTVITDTTDHYGKLWAWNFIIFLAYFVFTMLGGLVLGFSGSSEMPFYLWFVAWLVPLLIVLVLVIVLVAIRELYLFLQRNFSKQKTPGIISSFIKAKKHKVCPRIEWVD